MMCKRSLIFIFFCIVICSELRAQIPGNWLVGASAGFVRQIGTYNINLFYNRIPTFPPTFGFDNLRDVGSTYGIFTGYQFGCRGWLFGAELSADWYHTEHERLFVFSDLARRFFWNSSERFKRSPTLGVSGRVGFEMAPYFMSYFRMGFEGSRDKITSAFNSQTLPIFRRGAQSSDHRWLYRFVFGVGAETPLCFWPGMTFRLEYDYHLPCTRIVNATFVNEFIQPAFFSDVKPKMHVLKGSLVWHAPS